VPSNTRLYSFALCRRFALPKLASVRSLPTGHNGFRRKGACALWHGGD
jgi:hypothetical protein